MSQARSPKRMSQWDAMTATLDNTLVMLSDVASRYDTLSKEEIEVFITQLSSLQRQIETAFSSQRHVTADDVFAMTIVLVQSVANRHDLAKLQETTERLHVFLNLAKKKGVSVERRNRGDLAIYTLLSTIGLVVRGSSEEIKTAEALVEQHVQRLKTIPYENAWKEIGFRLSSFTTGYALEAHTSVDEKSKIKTKNFDITKQAAEDQRLARQFATHLQGILEAKDPESALRAYVEFGELVKKSLTISHSNINEFKKYFAGVLRDVAGDKITPEVININRIALAAVQGKITRHSAAESAFFGLACIDELIQQAPLPHQMQNQVKSMQRYLFSPLEKEVNKALAALRENSSDEMRPLIRELRQQWKVIVVSTDSDAVRLSRFDDVCQATLDQLREELKAAKEMIMPLQQTRQQISEDEKRLQNLAESHRMAKGRLKSVEEDFKSIQELQDDEWEMDQKEDEDAKQIRQARADSIIVEEHIKRERGDVKSQLKKARAKKEFLEKRIEQSDENRVTKLEEQILVVQDLQQFVRLQKEPTIFSKVKQFVAEHPLLKRDAKRGAWVGLMGALVVGGMIAAVSIATGGLALPAGLAAAAVAIGGAGLAGKVAALVLMAAAAVFAMSVMGVSGGAAVRFGKEAVQRRFGQSAKNQMQPPAPSKEDAPLERAPENKRGVFAGTRGKLSRFLGKPSPPRLDRVSINATDEDHLRKELEKRVAAGQDQPKTAKELEAERAADAVSAPDTEQSGHEQAISRAQGPQPGGRGGRGS